MTVGDDTMFDILILEDSIDTKNALEAIIKPCSSEIRVFFAANLKQAEELLDEQDFCLFFLDVNLSGNNIADASGIKFAKSLRKRTQYEFTPIVFVTSMLEFELLSYRETQCYRYIIKPFHDSEIRELVLKVINNQRQKEHPQVIVKKAGINYSLNIDEIIYIEAMPRGIIIHLIDENLEVKYLSIKQMMEKLSNEHFIQCHRMCVVNVSYIDYVDQVNRVIKLKDNYGTVDIGVTYKAEIRRFVHE